jgi:hypothetical protein
VSGFRELCRRVCAEAGWELLSSGIRVPLPGGRHQLVEIEEVEPFGHERIRLVTTVGTAETLGRVRHAVALGINAELAHGAFARREEELVMVETLAASCAAEEFESAVRYLAEIADDWEARLYGGDEY